jgi:hypothetical protein
MRPIVIAAGLLTLIAGLSGCTMQDATDGPASLPAMPAAPATNATTASLPVTLGVPATVETRSETASLNGTSTPLARITVLKPGADVVTAVDRTDADASGHWSLQRKVEPGHNRFRVIASNGSSTAVANLTVIRMVTATFQVDYKSSKAAVNDVVWIDLDANASAPMYAGKDVQHPPHANVHDLMVTWSAQTGKDIVYSYYHGIGYFVNAIDGAGTPGTVGDTTGVGPWCFEVNGKTADFGITSQPLAPGDVVLWTLGCA